tara:strand:+ start:1775 stop:2461 length:687 start_codon:yes stop_codon:yes gene_type:complete
MNANDLSTALAQSKVQETSGMSGVSFLKLNYRTGEWTLGVDDDIVTGDEVLVNTASIQHGWILWSANRPSKLMVAFTADLPMAMDPIGKDIPQEARTFLAAMYDDGEMISYEGNSFGCRKGVDVLLGKIRAHSAEGSKHLFPLVRLETERYHSTKVMKDANGEQWVYNPVFEIVCWCNQDGEKEGAPAPAVEDQTAAPVDDSPDEAPATETAPPKPRRQRRQRPQPAA